MKDEDRDNRIFHSELEVCTSMRRASAKVHELLDSTLTPKEREQVYDEALRWAARVLEAATVLLRSIQQAKREALSSVAVPDGVDDAPTARHARTQAYRQIPHVSEPRRRVA